MALFGAVDALAEVTERSAAFKRSRSPSNVRLQERLMTITSSAVRCAVQRS